MALTTIDLSTTIAFWIRFLSTGLILSCCLTVPSSVEAENPPCTQTNGQRNNCLKITKTTVIENRITHRLKAIKANGRAINNLDLNNFKIEVDGIKLKPESIEWQKPGDRTSPARIIMLLDYSGSMNSEDLSGKTK